MPLRSLLVLLSLLGSTTLVAQDAARTVDQVNKQGVYLGDLTWPQAEQKLATAPLVVLPFAGGAKEHGRHLPMNADARVMQHLTDFAVARRNIIVAPPILYGWFPAFREFPGTEIEDPAVFQRYVFLAAKSLVASGAKRVVFLNTGITRATGLPMAIAAREIRAQCGVSTLVVSWDDLETSEVEQFQEQPWGGHADEIETSINLALQPELVTMDNADRDLGLPPKQYPGYRPGKLLRQTPEGKPRAGIRGDATLATAEKGRKALAIMENNWLAALDGLSSEALPPRTGHCGDTRL